MRFALLLLFFPALSSSSSSSRGPLPDLARWRWRCVNDKDCVRHALKDGEYGDDGGMDLDGCKSVCGPHGSMFPHPVQSKMGGKLADFHLDKVTKVSQMIPGSIPV
jgi:hypothetical protein